MLDKKIFFFLKNGNLYSISGQRRVLLIQLESSTQSRLKLMAVPPKQFGVTTSSLDQVTVILIQYQIFYIFELNIFFTRYYTGRI
jgi:hypothetical protein